jgi:hypothetical protein
MRRPRFIVHVIAKPSTDAIRNLRQWLKRGWVDDVESGHEDEKTADDNHG